MGNEAFINLEDGQSRNEVLTSFLLGNFPHSDKAEIFSAMESVRLFPEYTGKSGVVQAGVFLSPDVIYAQTAFPFPFKPYLTFTTLEVKTALLRETEARKKKDLLARIAEAGNAARLELEKENLESIKDKFTYVLDKYKSSFDYDPNWSIVEAYKKKILTPFECVQTEISELDEKSYGLRLGHLHVLMGFAGAGKSTLTLNLAYKAISQGKNVVFFSTELTKEDILYQLAACHSFHRLGKEKAYSYRAFLTNGVDLTSEMQTLQEEIENTLKNPNLFGRIMFVDSDDLCDYSLSSLRNFCDSLPVYPDVFIVDYFQRLPVGAKNKEDERFKQGSIVKNFAELAKGNEKHRHMAVLLNSQTNRSGYKESKESGSYDLTAISEISQLEKEASLVMGVRQSKELGEKGCIGIDVVKCRGGKDKYSVEVPIEWRFLAVGDVIKKISDLSFDPEEFLRGN